MSIKRLLIMLSFLVAAASAQQITIGPLITPDKCVVVPGYTELCFATDGVHASFGGSPFGGALCDSSNPACKGPKGDKGDSGPAGVDGGVGPQGPSGSSGPQGPQGVIGASGPQGVPGQSGPQGSPGVQGVQGIQGPSGVVVGITLTVDSVCPKGTGTVQSGSKIQGCVLKVTAIQ